MKIASSGIGTVATAQGFNGASAKPYQWAWDATKETAASIVSGQTFTGIVQQSLSIVPTGVKVVFGTSTAGAYMDFHDATSLGVSGKLNKLDTPRAKYLHGVFDFTNAGAELTDEINLGGTPTISDPVGVGDVGRFDMYWFREDGTSESGYSGSSPIAAFGTLARTVLVWDMTNPDTHPARWPDSNLDGFDWQNMDPAEAPFRLEFYTDLTTNLSYYIMNGYVLSDRILGPTDISLPVDLLKARS